MMRDLLAFYEKRGSFPNDLKQMEGVVWEKKADREFSVENRALNHRNYLYLYTRLNSPRVYALGASYRSVAKRGRNMVPERLA